MFEGERKRLSHEIHHPHSTGEGQTHHLGDLGSNLTGFAVEGITSDQNEIEGAELLQRQRERSSRRQGVRSGKGGVTKVHPAGGAPRHRFAHDIFSR